MFMTILLVRIIKERNAVRYTKVMRLKNRIKLHKQCWVKYGQTQMLG